MSLEKDGYEVLENTAPADELKKANRRRALIFSGADEQRKAAYNSQGADMDRVPGAQIHDE